MNVYDDADEEHSVSSGPVGDVMVGEQVKEINFHPQHSCGAGAEINLPPGAGAEITNCSAGSFFLSKKFFRKLSWMLKKFL
jgi:hypothetical protein